MSVSLRAVSLMLTFVENGSVSTNSLMVVTPDIVMSSAVMRVTGSVFSVSTPLMFEPVTVNASSVTGSSAGLAGGVGEGR